MPASLCSSELREGVTNTGLLVTRLAWMAFGEISSQLFKYIYPKVSLQSQPQRVSWEHWPAKISAVVPVGEGWGQRSSQLPRNIHPLHGIQHLCFYFFFLFPHTCVSQISRVDPPVDLFERKSVGNLLEDVDFRGLCLPCLCQTQTTDSMRWLFTEKVVSCHFCLLFSMIS